MDDGGCTPVADNHTTLLRDLEKIASSQKDIDTHAYNQLVKDVNGLSGPFGSSSCRPR